MKNIIAVINLPLLTSDLFYKPNYERDEIAKSYIFFRELIEKNGYRFACVPYCHRSDNGDAEQELTFSSDIHNVAAVLSFRAIRHPILQQCKIPRERLFLCTSESTVTFPYLFDPILTKTFGTIFVLLDNYVDNKNYFKFYHMQARDALVKDIPDFNQKKLCLMMQTNPNPFIHPKELYSERRKIARFLPGNEFDLFGNGWSGFPAWRGYFLKDKLTILKNYKFYICYENTRDEPGYITERLFECFYGGCVPIYLGAPNVTDTIPKECFIDRRNFSSNAELYEYIKSIDRNSYHNYLEAARAFLNNEKTKENYSPASFATTLAARIFEICK